MLKITLQSAATLRGEINIKEVTFRFYANIKDAKQLKETFTTVSVKLT